MRTFDEIIELIKDVISLEYGNKKIKDKDVAYELGLTAENIATKKTRCVTPFYEIICFCHKRNINPNTLFFKA